MVLTRSLIGVIFSIVILQFEGGFRILRTNRIGQYILRALLFVISSLTFFAALAVLPLAIFWGWSIFGDIPDTRVLVGVALIAGSGIYVFLREGRPARKT